MANNRTLTAADAILMMTVDTIYPTPFRIKGFAADDVTNMDAVDNAETSMGVDGRLSAGFVFAPTRQTITLQADSETNDLFEYWAMYERTNRRKYFAGQTIKITATGRQYICVRGVLRSYTPMPALRRTAQPRSFVIEWESVTPAPAV